MDSIKQRKRALVRVQELSKPHVRTPRQKEEVPFINVVQPGAITAKLLEKQKEKANRPFIAADRKYNVPGNNRNF